MKKIIVMGLGLVLLLAAASTVDAEIIRDLEFFESLDTLQSEEQEVIEKMSEEDLESEEQEDEK